jgi:hypothetical protein
MKHSTSSKASKRMAYNPANQDYAKHLSDIQEGARVIESIMFGIDPNCGISQEAQSLALQYQKGQLQTA